MDSFEKELNAYLETSGKSTEQLAQQQGQDDNLSCLQADRLCPDGFELSADPRYAYNQCTSQWLDLQTGVYSYYDAETQTYIPMAVPDPLENSESDFSGVVRLVVQRSTSFTAGHYVDIGAMDELRIGRDWPEDSLRFLRIPEISVSRIHALMFLGEVPEEKEEPKGSQKLLYPEAADGVKDTGSEDGEIESIYDDKAGSVHVGCGDLSEGECSETHSQSPELRPREHSNEPSVFVVDQGSTHGTFVNGERISQAKAASLPHRLEHLDQVEIGQTVLQIHIHKQWACSKCSSTGDNEISTTHRASQIPLSSTAGPEAIESSSVAAKHSHSARKARIEELNAIKLKYMPLPRAAAQRPSQGSDQTKANRRSGRYQDRAMTRRQIQNKLAAVKDVQPSDTACSAHCSSDYTPKTQQPAPISRDNQGFSLLQKMGWVPGSGLGSDSSGIVNPIEAQGNIARAGLGSSDDKDDDRRTRLARLTRERFSQL
ncbi:hypothetical protein GGF40_003352 [Coemansia sp. RSA 1286]|nr:hypothetical protein GGF40_003352 [Coemansia sp. RSA 1286]